MSILTKANIRTCLAFGAIILFVLVMGSADSFIDWMLG